MPRYSEDGSIWTIDGEISDLVERLTAEDQRREENLIDAGDLPMSLEHVAGAVDRAVKFDGTMLLRLAQVCEYQQSRIEQLERWVEQHGSDAS